MRVNLNNENLMNSTNQKILRFITSHIKEFAKEYDVQSSKIMNYTVSDEYISTLFCSWMSDHEILNMKPYRLTTTDGVKLAEGWEIIEDELLTLRLLESVQ